MQYPFYAQFPTGVAGSLSFPLMVASSPDAFFHRRRPIFVIFLIAKSENRF